MQTTAEPLPSLFILYSSHFNMSKILNFPKFVQSSFVRQHKTEITSQILRTVSVSHHWGIAEGVLFSDTIPQGADQGSLSPASSRTPNSSHQNESRGEEGV